MDKPIVNYTTPRGIIEEHIGLFRLQLNSSYTCVVIFQNPSRNSPLQIVGQCLYRYTLSHASLIARKSGAYR